MVLPPFVLLCCCQPPPHPPHARARRAQNPGAESSLKEIYARAYLKCARGQLLFAPLGMHACEHTALPIVTLDTRAAAAVFSKRN